MKNDDKELIYISIDNKQYKEKPKSSQVGYIQKSLSQKLDKFSISEFAEKVGNYQSFRTSVYKYETKGEGSKNFLFSRIIALDFDNDNAQQRVTKEEIRNRDFIKNNACFIYDSISNSIEKEKFRVVFILKYPIVKDDDFRKLYGLLIEKFPECDKLTKSSSNIFFGGSNSIEIDFSNRLNPKDFIDNFEVINDEAIEKLIEQKYKIGNQNIEYKQDISRKEEKEKKYLWQFLKSDEIEKAKEISIKYNKEFESYSDATVYFKKLNIQEFLGFSPDNPFRSPFREDKNPSVTCYQNNEGIWLYEDKGREERPFDLIDLLREKIIKKVMNTQSRQTIIDLLLDLTNCTIKKTDESKKIENRVTEIKSVLLDENIEEKYPNIYSVIIKKKYTTIINEILSIFSESRYEIKNEVYYLSWQSANTLSNKISLAVSEDITQSRIKNALVVVRLLGIIDNLADEEIPEELFKVLEKSKAEKEKRKKNATSRRSNVSKINAEITIQEIERNAQILIDNKFSIGKLSREWVLTYFGESKANKIYPQDIERSISRESREFIDECVFILNKYIRGGNGWIGKGRISKKDLFEHINRRRVFLDKLPYSDNKMNTQWGKFENEICKLTNLSINTVNRESRENFYLSENYIKRNSKVLIDKELDSFPDLNYYMSKQNND